MMTLPQPTTTKEFNSIQRSNPTFEKAIRSFFEKEIAADDLIRPFENGSCPTYSIAEKFVAKFFPDLFLEGYKTELWSLKSLEEKNFLAPRLVSSKQDDGWNVILMEQLDGVPLNTIWDKLSEAEKLNMSFKIGQQIQDLHSIKSSNKKIRDSWESFLNTQKKNCYKRQKQLGLREDLLEQIPGFIDASELQYKDLVFLHTEVMLDHVIVKKNTEPTSISGFIDFEPSMWGAAEYEFASVGVFIARGDLKIFKAFISGYGVNVDSNFHRRIMAFLILHRYCNLDWYLKFMPGGESLDELAEKWFKV